MSPGRTRSDIAAPVAPARLLHLAAPTHQIVHFLPEFGQIICLRAHGVIQYGLSGEMGMAEPLDDLVAHLEGTLGLGGPVAARVIDEVLAYFHETVDQFVLRRHAELQAESQRNDDIFDQIRAELAHRRFAAPALTERQLRRLIYG